MSSLTLEAETTIWARLHGKTFAVAIKAKTVPAILEIMDGYEDLTEQSAMEDAVELLKGTYVARRRCNYVCNSTACFGRHAGVRLARWLRRLLGRVERASVGRSFIKAMEASITDCTSTMSLLCRMFAPFLMYDLWRAYRKAP